MPKKESIIKAALTAAAPVILGYLTMGTAFGMLLVNQVPNSNAWWCALFSPLALSGSMQFASVEMFRNAASYTLFMTAVMALLINIRYCVYGLPFLRLFRCYPWYQRLFLIQNLSDETYAIMVSSTRHGRDRRNFMMLVAAFDYSSWIVGTIIGAMLGTHLPFSTEGIDFSMVALFVVILVDLCRKRENWLPAIIGGASTFLVLSIAVMVLPSFANKSLLLAMIIMTAVLLAIRPKNTQEGA